MSGIEIYNEQLIRNLHGKGAFLISGGDKPNPMTIGWGFAGVIWRMDVFIAAIRPTRYTYGLVEETGEFNICVPKGDLSGALSLCGTKSGRDLDKIAAAELMLAPARKNKTPIIADCGLHFECRVLYSHKLEGERLPDNIIKSSYPGRDFHTLYYAEILECYVT